MQLPAYLKKQGESASDFAKRINMTRSTVSRLLDGSRQPSLDLALAIQSATAGKVTPVDFFRAKLKKASEAVLTK